MKYKTQNEAWGFYGTAILSFGLSEKDVKSLYSFTAAHLSNVYDVNNPVEFLDSRYGRHFCDRVHDQIFDQELSLDRIKSSVRKAAKSWGKF